LDSEEELKASSVSRHTRNSITDVMTTPDTPPTRRPHPVLRKSLGFVAGLGAGVGLWTIIALITENVLIGLIFGMLPGLAIGFGLQLTSRR
jgi:hypothetical protein